jgi:nicotinamide riboside transporter PnuC
MTILISVIISLLSIAMLWFMGNKSIIGPVIGLINQAFWFYYIYTTKQWCLLGATVAFTVVHLRNLYKWYREEFRCHNVDSAR